MSHKLAISLSVVSSLVAADVWAADCTIYDEATRNGLSDYPLIYGGEETADVPANVFFLGTQSAPPSWREWSDEAGEPIAFAEDTELSARLAVAWQEPSPYLGFRPVEPLVLGDRYVTAGCEESSCFAFTVGEEDTTPPERAVISGLEVLFGNGANDGQGFSCPDWDFLEMNVLGSDDRTPDGDLIALAYFAPTAELVPMQTSPGLVFKPGPRLAQDVGALRRVRVELGLSWRRQRDGLHFRKRQPYCFSIALMDRAGNVGPMSEPECISTVDVDAPYATVPDYGCCSVPAGRSPAAPLALALCVLGLAGVARRR